MQNIQQAKFYSFRDVVPKYRDKYSKIKPITTVNTSPDKIAIKLTSAKLLKNIFRII
jgi:hypothetical protein